MYNAISLAATMIATCYQDGELDAANLLVPPNCFFNTDATSICLAAKDKKLYITYEGYNHLLEHNMHASLSRATHKNRWVSFLPLLNAAGQSVANVFVVYDDSFTEDGQLVKVRKTCRYTYIIVGLRRQSYLGVDEQA